MRPSRKNGFRLCRGAGFQTVLLVGKFFFRARPLAMRTNGLPLGLPVSSSRVAVGRRLSAETERRVAVIVEQAHARGGDGEPCLELLAGPWGVDGPRGRRGCSPAAAAENGGLYYGLLMK